MARHLLRDYLTPGAGNYIVPYIGSYLAAIFMRRVLGYSYVGDTRFPINNTGTLLISTADSTPTSTPTFAGGTKAGINVGSGLEFNASIPAATRVVGSGDVGKILVLKSTTNPTYNSGCFLITGFDAGTNSYALDFRSGAVLSGATSCTSSQTLPTSNINVVSTSTFPSSGSVLIVSSTGTQTVNYTGTNGTQFTGCTGGTGTISSGSAVNRSVTLPQATILANTSTTHFPSSGTLFIYSSTGRQTVTYTGITATSFTGCSGGTGNVVSGVADGNGKFASPIIATINTTIAAGSNGQNLPQATINVAATRTASTTITASSNNVALPQGTINVSSTSGFPTSGWIYVTTGNGPQLVTYTGTSGTTFTGCTGGSGYMTTGNAVVAGYDPTSGIIYVTTSAGVQQVSYTGTTSTTFTGCTGGTGTMSTGGLVYYSPMVPRIEASDSMNWYLYEADSAAQTQGGNQNLVSPTFSITNETGTNGSPYTVTLSGAHQFVTGQRVTITGVTGVSNGSNGTWTITVTGGSTFTINGLTWGATTTYTGGGTLTIPDVILPATLFVNSATGYSSPSNNLYVHSSSGIQKLTWNGIPQSAGGKVALPGITGGVGTVSIGGAIYDNTSNANSTSQYRGNGISTAPRLILQSPHALGWQVRICHETVDDTGVTSSSQSAECPMITMSAGFGGNASGDFLVSGPHIHAPLYLNSNNNNLQGGAPGFGGNLNFPNGTSFENYRITIAGDTDGYGLTICGRRPGNATAPRSYLMTFGMCESESLPLPPNNEARLFAIGSGNSQSSGDNLNDLSWFPGNISTSGRAQGITQSPSFGNYATPSSLCTSFLTYATGVGAFGSPIFDGSAGDTPWFGGVELFPIDIISGTFNTWNNSAVTNYGFPLTQGRFLGTIPHIREGRSNFAEYSVTADLVGQHMRRGLWMLWGGPPVVP